MPTSVSGIRLSDDMVSMVTDLLSHRDHLALVLPSVLATPASSSISEFIRKVSEKSPAGDEATRAIVSALWNISNGIMARNESASETIDHLTKAIEKYNKAPLDSERLAQWNALVPGLNSPLK